MHRRTRLAALLLVLALGCSKDKGTNPTGGRTFDIPMPAGRSAVFTFDHAATHPYKCGIHPSMTGTVVIAGTATLDSAVVSMSSVAGGFDPQTVTIKVGGYVRWVNNSATVDHSVVSDN